MRFRVGESISFKADSELADGLQRLAERLQLQNASAVVRYAVAMGLESAERVDLALARRAVREGQMEGLSRFWSEFHVFTSKLFYRPVIAEDAPPNEPPEPPPEDPLL